MTSKVVESGPHALFEAARIVKTKSQVLSPLFEAPVRQKSWTLTVQSSGVVGCTQPLAILVASSIAFGSDTVTPAVIASLASIATV